MIFPQITVVAGSVEIRKQRHQKPEYKLQQAQIYGGFQKQLRVTKESKPFNLLEYCGVYNYHIRRRYFDDQLESHI